MNHDEEQQLRGIAAMITRADPVLAQRLTGRPNRRNRGLSLASHAVLALCAVLSLLGVSGHQAGIALISCLLLMTVYPLLLAIKTSRP